MITLEHAIANKLHAARNAYWQAYYLENDTLKAEESIAFWLETLEYYEKG